MPVVKSYRRTSGTGDTQLPLVQQNIPSAAFGADRARVISNIGDRIVNVGLRESAEEERETNRLNTVKVRSALNKARIEDREFINGLLTREGEDALTVNKEALDYFNERKSTVLETLENDAQRELFSSAYETYVVDNTGLAFSHQERQLGIIEDRERTAQIKNAKDDALINRYDFSTLEGSYNEALAEVTSKFSKFGPQVEELEVRNFKTEFHTSLINAYLSDGSISYAKRYYEAHKANMSSEAQLMVEKNLKAGSALESARDSVEKILMDTDDFTEQLAKAREIKDSSISDEVVRRLKIRASEKQNAERERRSMLIDSQVKKILEAGTYEERLSIAYETRLAGYSGSANDSVELMRLAQSLSERRDKKTTDFKRIAAVRAMIDAGSIASEEKLIMALQPYAKDADLKETIEYFRRSGKTGQLSDADVRRTFNALLGRSAEEEAELYDDVWRFVKRNLPAGKSPTDDIIRDLVGKALMEGEVKSGSWYLPDTDIRLAEITEDEAQTWEPDERPEWVPLDAIWSTEYNNWIVRENGELYIVTED